MANQRNEVADDRRSERRQLEGDVTVEILAQEIEGPGENVSEEGALFATTGAVRVRVLLPGEPTARAGELVRLTPLGGGRLGLAVRFDPRHA